MLLALVELSREQSSDKRREVLQQVSNLFLDGAENHSDRELVLFSEIMTRLLDQVAVEDRAQLSDRVARTAAAPRAVIMKLARDDVDVAAPVLEHSQVLTNTDLLEIARHEGQDHLMALSRRAALDAQVTDVIVDRGEDRVLRSVARNTGARFSETGYAHLAEKAGTIDGLGEVLARRSDLSSDLARKILPALSDESRRRLQTLIRDGGGRATRLLEQAADELAASRNHLRRERLEVRLMVADIKAHKRRLDEAMDQLIFEKRLADIAYVIAEMTELEFAHVSNAIHKPSAIGVAAACRVLDMPSTVYGRLMELRCEKLRLNPAMAEDMTRAYGDMDRPMAERALRFHRVSSGLKAARRG